MPEEKTVKINATVMWQTVEGLKRNAEENNISEDEVAERLISRWKTDNALVALNYILAEIVRAGRELGSEDDIKAVLAALFDILRKSLPKSWAKDIAEQVEELFKEHGVRPIAALPEYPLEQEMYGGDGSEQ